MSISRGHEHYFTGFTHLHEVVTGTRRKTSSSEPSALQAVAELMEERSKYEKWLRDLEAKKDATPAHVYERVRGDYRSRLDGVMDQLREHTSSMQTHARTLMMRLRELESAEQDLKDEHTEQELRANVGELTPGEWETISRKAQRAITKLQEDQQQIADDLIRIRDLLEGRTEDDEEEGEEEEEAPRHSTDFNELEFLKSVVGPSTPSASSTPASPRKAADLPRPSGERIAEPSSGARRVTPTPAPAAVNTPSKPAAAVPARPSVEKPAEKPAEEKPAAPAAPRMQVTSDSPLTLRTSSSGGAVKTLKCAECGTMNSANEWYCEKCGGELANI